MTHINQINNDQTQRINTKSSKGKKQITYKGILIKITADLSTEILQAIREWQDILKVMKEKNLQPRLLYPARISLKYEGEIKSFTHKQKIRQMSRQVSRGSAGDYQADEWAGVAWLSWRLSGR